jgi:DNA-directed RNA polymerase III subunit RPC2
MVGSKVLDCINFEKLGGGQNAMVAVMSYSGYDIEDAVVLNRASLDRGYGRAMVIKRYTSVIKVHPNRTSDRVVGPPQPDPSLAGADRGRWDERNARYRALGPDGICEVGAQVAKGSVLLNRQTPENTTEMIGIGARDAGKATSYRPAAVSYKEPDGGTVDKVVLTSSATDKFVVKVLVRDLRRPELGDKFSSRHGQKGVVGIIVPQENMPFNEQGICPDMIMNPHGFPSRMTVGKMIELVAGKAGLQDGKRRHGTAFAGDKVWDVGQVLVDRGMNYHGKELLYNGITGQPYSAYIFMGPIYYQRLKHMVKDKMFARARGPHVVLTRQPTQGRARDGGLRVGEMERDCLVAHGTANLLVERLLVSSDPFMASVCTQCGILAYSGWCQYCKRGDAVSDFRIPYACKLLFQELQSMNVQPRIRLKEGGFFDKGSITGEHGGY